MIKLQRGLKLGVSEGGTLTYSDAVGVGCVTPLQVYILGPHPTPGRV